MALSILRQALRTTSLLAALDKVRDKHGAAGTDGQTVGDFAAQARMEIATLQAEVVQKRYQPRPLLRVRLPRTAQRHSDGADAAL